MEGLWVENGPFRGTPSSLNAHSWHQVANVLYVDQPIGTGLSWTNTNQYDGSDDNVNAHFWGFLQNFFKLHSNYIDITCPAGTQASSCSRPFFVFGESYAGHYILSFSNYLLQANRLLTSQSADSHINLAGVGVGNGWVDPYHQYSMGEFAHSMGLISSAQAQASHTQSSECKLALNRSEPQPIRKCLKLMDDIVAATKTSSSSTKVNQYDTRLWLSDAQADQNYPAGMSSVRSMLNTQSIRDAINMGFLPVNQHSWEHCSGPVWNALGHLDGVGVTAELANVLNSGVRALFFNGQYDMVCHHLGTESYLDVLDWKDSHDFRKAKREVWGSSSSVSGFVRSSASGILTFIVVLRAGHMVPTDVPAESLDLLRRFITKQSFATTVQNLAMEDGVVCAQTTADASNIMPSAIGILVGIILGGGLAGLYYRKLSAVFSSSASSRGRGQFYELPRRSSNRAIEANEPPDSDNRSSATAGGQRRIVTGDEDGVFGIEGAQLAAVDSTAVI
jgi:carboxypeptidase D